MRGEETRDLGERLFSLWRIRFEKVLGVGHTLEYLQYGINTSLVKFPVSEHSVTEEQVACTAGKDCRRKAVKVAVDRREWRVPQVMPVGIKLRRTGQVAVVTHQDVVQPLIRLVGVAGV